MKDVLKNRNFMLLWAAGLISYIGTWVLHAALPFYIFELTGSAMATAGIFMAFLAPGIIFGSIAGVFVDRWNKLRTMLAVNLLQMLIVIGLVLVQSAETSWVLFVVLFVISSIAQFMGPAENALLPKLVQEEQLVAANSLNSMNDNIARLIGPAVGGVVLATQGFSSVVFIDAASFALAAILIFIVMLSFSEATKPEVASASVQDSKGTASFREQLTGVISDWKDGLDVVRSKPILSNTLAIIGAALFADAIVSAILVIFLQEELGMGSSDFGYIMTARGIGGLIGGILLGQLGNRINPRHLLSGSLLALSLVLFAAVNTTSLLVLLVLMVIGGVPAVGIFIAVQTIFQKNAPEAYLGRVFGLFQAVIMLLMFVGSVAAGVLGESIAASQIMLGAVTIYLLAAVLGIWLMRDRHVVAETVPN